MPASRNGRSAYVYAQRLPHRLAVFPVNWIDTNGACSCRRADCTNGGKHPLTPHGCNDASFDVDLICRWWTRWPWANVAIATGPISGIFVVDVDPRHCGDESLAALEAEHGRLPDTPTVLTGSGGLHLFFHLPAGVEIRNSSSEIGAGLDVRGTGGYVIAPPSLHTSGNLYYWEISSRIDEIPLAEPSDWLIQLILHPPARLQGASNGQHLPAGQVDFQRLVAGIPDGKRDQELFRLACFLHRQGYSRAYVEGVVLDAAQRCQPRVSQRVAQQKVKSAWRYS